MKKKSKSKSKPRPRKKTFTLFVKKGKVFKPVITAGASKSDPESYYKLRYQLSEAMLELIDSGRDFVFLHNYKSGTGKPKPIYLAAPPPTKFRIGDKVIIKKGSIVSVALSPMVVSVDSPGTIEILSAATATAHVRTMAYGTVVAKLADLKR